ncbi:unnamed protein product [Closterium sp. Naga37s-1]|nr:unnamed protein product [Closterium sp. Naga37s-1]
MEQDLPEDLGKLSNLQQLHIRFCPIGKLPASFTALSSLHILTIEHCNELASVTGSLDNLKGLKQLTLKLEGTVQRAAGISSSSDNNNFPELKNLEHVEHLELAIGQAVEQFPFPRFPFPQLRILKLSYGEQIRKLPSNLGRDLPQLRQLRLHFTNGLTELPETITLLQHLTSLDVEYASQLASLPHGIGALSRLRRLRLSHCSALQHLPASLTRLKCLHELDAEGACIRALPPNVAQLTRLRRLSLKGCKQLRVLPEGVTDLKMLRFLGLKGSELAIDNVSEEQECGFRRIYDLRTDFVGSE